ncbi:hypothetical protein F7734_18485 [Scytonema sp. UIC 10036]|nr:hypothetical protein [Scytonema sp. UIC 10036]
MVHLGAVKPSRSQAPPGNEMTADRNHCGGLLVSFILKNISIHPQSSVRILNHNAKY